MNKDEKESYRKGIMDSFDFGFMVLDYHLNGKRYGNT